MAEFLTTPAGIALIIVAQGLLMAIFLLLSAYFLIYADRKVWAADRKEPRNGYFEFEAQPPMMTP